MLKCASKFFFEKILPSVLATVTAAYIVNHYIAGPADAPPKAAAVLPNNPEAGVRAKGISEKAIAGAPTEKVQPEAASGKPNEKRAETASLPTGAKKHQAARRERAAKVASVPAAPAQTVSAPDDHRDDANVLARAAIDRLRSTNDTPVRVEAARSRVENSRLRQDADRQPVESTSPRLQQVTRAGFPPAIQPLPPPIQVSTPAVETSGLDTTGSGEGSPSDRADDQARLPVPPADIPQAPPLDLEANAAPALRAHTTVADDMLSAAKSVVQAVLPR
ncbi:MAG: hypothetical protein NTAFB05_18170 [Nitrobacter sp.]|uniref:hypothetical protein n=1 Tax=Nitrobacter sp. TaxID=29420 RepID=UPI00387DEE0A